MFTLIKIREGLAINDYNDPGPYKYPEGSVAYEFQSESWEAPRQEDHGQTKMPEMEMHVIKPAIRKAR